MPALRQALGQEHPWGKAMVQCGSGIQGATTNERVNLIGALMTHKAYLGTQGPRAADFRAAQREEPPPHICFHAAIPWQ